MYAKFGDSKIKYSHANNKNVRNTERLGQKCILRNLNIWR